MINKKTKIYHAFLYCIYNFFSVDLCILIFIFKYYNYKKNSKDLFNTLYIFCYYSFYINGLTIVLLIKYIY